MFKKFQKYAPAGLVIGLVAAAAALILRISAGQLTLTAKILIGVAVLGMVPSPFSIPLKGARPDTAAMQRS